MKGFLTVTSKYMHMNIIVMCRNNKNLPRSIHGYSLITKLVTV